MDDNATPEPPPAPAPNPFVVPPAAPDLAPPSRRATVTKRVRNGVIALAVIGIGLVVMGHIGRGSVSTNDLDAGMCIRMPQGSFKSAHREDCAKPHDAEILGRVDDVDTMPVLQGQPTEASRACDSRFEQYSGTTLDASTYHVGFFETNSVFAAAHGDVLCFVRLVDGAELTHSLRQPTI
jgi:hypothetical protein